MVHPLNVFIHLFMIYVFAYHSKGEVQCSASCGSLRNISHPFRLQGDPNNCGDPNYVLSCVNNRTRLNLQSKIYYVNSISYHNQSIRVVDSGLKSDNCSSRPLYFLSSDDLSSSGSYTFVTHSYQYIAYVNCSSRFEDSSYVSTRPCINSTTESFLYVLRSDGMEFNLTQSCVPIAMVPTSLTNVQNMSYVDVWDSLLAGFELSWRPSLCGECEDAGGSCSYPFPYENPFVCYNPCRRLLQSTKCTAIQILIILGYVLAGRTGLGIFCMLLFLIYKLSRILWSRHKSLQKMNCNIERFLEKYKTLIPTRYSYAKIKKMTNRFTEKLGQGGFGSVYKGSLSNGQLIAVKILSKSKGNGEEFINEVATIGTIHHVNIVQLIGFCSEDSKRALIYDYMPNGSLEKYLYPRCNEESELSMEKRYDIALGAARGIEYLHRGCEMQILHFDIKPHNILLDSEFNPKVSDFGLAKLYPVNHSVVSVSAAKGTFGYIAPELFYRNFGRISYKSDVYSFGMLLLEMSGRKKELQEAQVGSDQNYFPTWIHEQIVIEEEMSIDADIESEAKKIKRLLIMVGLWCIQMRPIDRPSMSRVVEMLEGSVEDLEMPPKPFSVFAAPANSSTNATELSNAYYSETSLLR